MRSCGVLTNGTTGRVGSGNGVEVLLDGAGEDLAGHVAAGAVHGGEGAVGVVFGLVEDRRVGPSRCCADQLGEHVGPRRAVAGRCFLEAHPVLHDPRQALLAVADDEEVDERSEQFRILRTRPAGNDQRMIERPITRVQRNAAQVEHGQHVGVTDLVLQTEADDVELGQRREGFQAVQRQVVLAQLASRNRSTA